MPPKRVMVLGASGSLGGYLADSFRAGFSVVCPPPRGEKKRERPPGISWTDTALDIECPVEIARLLREAQPDIIVNCIAVTPRSPDSNNDRICRQVNAVFPHRLAEAAHRVNAYVIQISTDAVFSGRKGGYAEIDPPDPVDPYGDTKLLGELEAVHCITLRTTFYGVFHTGAGLLHWFLHSAPDQWRGYANYVFSPLSAQRLAVVIRELIDRDDRPHGIYHVGGEATTKLRLLQTVQESVGLPGTITPLDAPIVDRSLDSSMFWRLLGQPMPNHREMIEAMRPELMRAMYSRVPVSTKPRMIA